jgi:hypothetical protein
MCKHRVTSPEYARSVFDDSEKLTDKESEFIAKVLRETVDQSYASIRNLIAQLRLLWCIQK